LYGLSCEQNYIYFLEMKRVRGPKDSFSVSVNG
jgi:hypothetical protein